MNYHYAVMVRFLFLIPLVGAAGRSQACGDWVACCIVSSLLYSSLLRIGEIGPVNQDGKVKQRVAAENGVENWLTHTDLLDKVKNLPDVPSSLKNDFAADFAEASEASYDALAKFLTGELDVKDWEILQRMGRRDIKKNPKALQALSAARKNPRLAEFGITDDMLGNIHGFNLAYDELLPKIDELITFLPPNTQNLADYLGSKGFGQAGAANWTHRHSEVQLERLLQNKSILSGANEIVFERTIVGPSGKTSVSDLHIKKGTRTLEAETKAGVEFFNGLANSNSNFATQCENSFSQVSKLEDYKVFLGGAKMTNAKSVFGN